MRTGPIAMLAVLFAAFCLALPVRPAETEPPAQEAPETRKPEGQETGKEDESPAPEKEGPAVTKELRRRARERFRAMQKRRLDQLRKVLKVESDEKWAELTPVISRLFQLRRIRTMLQSGGYLALSAGRDEPLKAPALGEDILTEHLLMWSPDVDKDLVRALVGAYAELRGDFGDEKADEDKIKAAIKKRAESMADLDTRIQEAVAKLKEQTTARQQAGLILMGVLP